MVARDEVQGRARGHGFLALDAGLVAGQQPVEVGGGPGVQVGQVQRFAFLGVGDQVDDPRGGQLANRIGGVLLHG